MSRKNSILPLSLLFAAAAIGIGIATAEVGINPLMTDSDGAVRIVQNAHPGLSDVEADGYGWFACGVSEENGDIWRTDFTAKNAKGEQVSGTVCEGLLKGATIRFN